MVPIDACDLGTVAPSTRSQIGQSCRRSSGAAQVPGGGSDRERRQRADDVEPIAPLEISIEDGPAVDVGCTGTGDGGQRR